MWKISFVVIFYVLTIVQAKTLPSYIQKCSFSSPNLKDCILNSIIPIRPYLLKGIPEMGLPPIDPFYVPEIKLDQKTVNGEFVMDLKKLNVYGLNRFKILDLKTETKNNNFDVMIKIDLGKVDMDGDYNLNARFLLIPIKGNGKFIANATSIIAESTTKYEIIEKKGVKYLKNTFLDVKLTFGKNNILRFENLQQQNKIIAEATDRLLVENDDEILEEVKPAIEEVCEELLRKISVGILEQFPVNEIFLK